MKFPLVSRKRLNSANVRIGILESSLAKAGEEYDSHEASLMHCYETQEAQKKDIAKLSGHNATLKATLGTARAELVKANAEIKGQQAEIDRLTAAFEKLTADYNDLGKKIPAFRPKAIRWSGPDGARAAIERAAYAESPAGKQEAAAKLSI